VQDFRRLEVWNKAHRLTLDIYQATRAFPKEETYGLTSQLKRAATSIPTNLAEGCGRSGDAELKRFADIAMGSASEVEYLLLLAVDLEILSRSVYLELNEHVIEVKRMLAAFIVQLRPSKAALVSAN
jgi:four helix bundle protein